QIQPLNINFGESVFFTPSQRSPAPTTVWQKGAEVNNTPDSKGKTDVIDPQIAVSDSVVAVLTWGTLVFYDKSGKPLPSTPTFLNPTNIQTLFADLLPAINRRAHLNPLVASIPEFQMDQGQWGDARIVFDATRKRWVIVGTVKNKVDDKAPFPAFLRLSQRRTKILFAISRDEDPAKGFFTYFTNGTPDDGACDSIVEQPCPNTSFTPGNAGDYPSVGVSHDRYLVTLHVSHAPLDGSDWKPLYGYMAVFDAADVASGSSDPEINVMWDWVLAGGGHAEGVTMPVVMQQKLPVMDTAALIVSTHDDKFVITTVSGNGPSSLGSLAVHISDLESPSLWLQKGSFQLIDYTNTSNQPITANLVGNKLFAAMDDCRKWVEGQSDCSPSIHLFSLDLTNLLLPSIEIDRVFGWRSTFDDAQDDVVAYGKPGVAANADGDMVVVYSRTSPRIFSEVRYSTWMHNEPDLRPSQLLRKGDGPMPVKLTDCLPPGTCKDKRLDTAGVAVDPFDHRGIWIAHLFANSSGGWSVAVGKVFGKQHADLQMSDVNFSPSSNIFPRSSLHVTYKIANGGDGSAKNPGVKVVLIAADGGRTVLGDDAPADVTPSHSRTINYSVHIPRTLGPGYYTVRAEGRLTAGEAEYNDGNNKADASVKLKVLAALPGH
ncbi:MAG: hypothetical protein M3R52_02530, partial [Acidobacteriota bacterium]|nr:hypothetical protein [Acidobacteriota bacterium]